MTTNICYETPNPPSPNHTLITSKDDADARVDEIQDFIDNMELFEAGLTHRGILPTTPSLIPFLAIQPVSGLENLLKGVESVLAKFVANPGLLTGDTQRCEKLLRKCPMYLLLAMEFLHLKKTPDNGGRQPRFSLSALILLALGNSEETILKRLHEMVSNLVDIGNRRAARRHADDDPTYLKTAEDELEKAKSPNPATLHDGLVKAWEDALKTSECVARPLFVIHSPLIFHRNNLSSLRDKSGKQPYCLVRHARRLG